MKKKLLTVVFALGILLPAVVSGCGSASEAGMADTGNFAAEDKAAAGYEGEYNAAGEYYDDGEGYADTDEYYDDAEEQTDDADRTDEADSVSAGGKNSSVNGEMLVYTCYISLDTLEFDESIGGLKKLIEKSGGFIESETYSDGYEYYDYYIEDWEKNNSYSATIRVPSSEYGSFTDSVAELGDMKTKSASTENISTRYGTAKATLDIYEAERERYLEMLENTDKEKVMLEIEEKLFDLDIKIAEIKTNIDSMDTDVAYSYVNVEINEVRKYEVSDNGTFADRVRDAGENSLYYFGQFLEGIVLFFIHAFWYIIIGIVVLVIVLKVVKNRRSEEGIKKREERRMRRREKNAKK